ncbi:hypothetical protein PMZ80_005728 [Knufia obscura]|uniref:Signal peptidase complex subunit 1 n=2 Tax=Knufia TaxID=430999 RepID=A0AAN8I8C5_9EURO|nr:hypothetical protein PMZ80_005728 [Knufia obscura]KAK5954396.1 hypothetical protein OHC33_004118 [Knufia fluminis]
MDAIITQLQDVVDGQIDFEGQRVADLLSTVMLIVVSLVALVVGFIQQAIHLTMWITLAGTLATLLVVVPPWPSFNKNPQPWVGSRTKMSHGGILVQGMNVS